MDLNLLFAVILIAVLVGILWGTFTMWMYRGTTTIVYTIKERFYVLLLSCLLTALFFGSYAIVSGAEYYLYYVVAFFGVCIPVAIMLLPNWFGVYNKKN